MLGYLACFRSDHHFFHTYHIFVLSLGLPYWIRVEGKLVRFSERPGMDHQVVTVDQFTTAMASIQKALASLRQEMGS